MRVLVTGANGFLGRAVVAALQARGHAVCALVRPATRTEGLWPEPVEVLRADLRAQVPPPEALEGLDAVVHLAAAVTGDPEGQFASTVGGTERLLAALAAGAGRPRIVLASSLSVYDWSAAEGALTETTPVTPPDDARGGYTISKVWQERVVRAAAEREGFGLVVLRPGFIWGPGAVELGGTGQSLGSLHLVVGTRLPLTYVENCAECFALATESPAALGRTFNVIDSDVVSAWRYMGEYLRRTRRPGPRVLVPYPAGLALARFARWSGGRLFAAGGRLPSVLNPAQFEARFKPLRFPADPAREALGWRPRVSFEAALERAYAT